MLVWSGSLNFADVKNPPPCFLQLVRNLTAMASCHKDNYSILFHENVALKFPEHEVESVSTHGNEIKVMTNLLSSMGGSGALPLQDTQNLLQQIKFNEHALSDFYNLFHHRFLLHYYLNWSQLALYTDYDAAITQASSSKLIYTLCHLLGTSANVNNYRLNHHSYFMSMERSPEKLINVLRDHTLLDVEIDNHFHSSKEVPGHYLTKLSKFKDVAKNQCLGHDFFLGNTVRMDHCHFQVKLIASCYGDYCQMINNTQHLNYLRNLINSFVAQQLSFSIVVILRGERHPNICLSKKTLKASRLGRTTIMAKRRI